MLAIAGFVCFILLFYGAEDPVPCP
jgi:hypothetical protein